MFNIYSQNQRNMQESSTINNSLSIHENHLSSIYAYPFNDSTQNLDASISNRSGNKSTFRTFAHIRQKMPQKPQNLNLSFLELENLLDELEQETLSFQRVYQECQRNKASYYQFRERVIVEIESVSIGTQETENEKNQLRGQNYRNCEYSFKQNQINAKTKQSLRRANKYLKNIA